MSALIDLANLSAIQYSEAIADQIMAICEPLKHLGISHFGYFKFFKDGSYLKICNNLEWTKFYIMNNLADKTTAFAESILSVPKSELNIQLWPQSKGNDCLSALYDHNVWNGIDLTIKQDDYIEVYYFGTERENNQIFDLYINHIDLLMKFKAYFNEKAASIIESKDRKNLVQQNNLVSFFTEASVPTSSLPKSNINIESFFNETPISQYFLTGKYSHIYLTKREMECLWYLSQGRTSKEMGRIMNLSSRTVESYITNLKIKTGTHWKSELIDIFIENSLKDVFKKEILSSSNIIAQGGGG